MVRWKNLGYYKIKYGYYSREKRDQYVQDLNNINFIYDQVAPAEYLEGFVPLRITYNGKSITLMIDGLGKEFVVSKEFIDAKYGVYEMEDLIYSETPLQEWLQTNRK